MDKGDIGIHPSLIQNVIEFARPEDDMTQEVKPAGIDRDQLRRDVQQKYEEVARDPEQGFHFHTGLPLARMLGYSDADIEGLPVTTVESFAGVGNPFGMRRLQSGESVLDVGSGAGFDTLLAARQVGPEGSVIAVDMTEAMLEKTRLGAAQMALNNVDARFGYAESLPVASESVDVVISNGVINLTPDKVAVMREIWRVLKPGGRFQIGDVIVHLAVGQSDKDNIELWSG